jgi:hypothetical protein
VRRKPEPAAMPGGARTGPNRVEIAHAIDHSINHGMKKKEN